MEKITIEAGIETITADAHGNLLLMQLIDAFKDKVEIDGAQKVLDLLTKEAEESYESLKDRISDLEITVENKDIEIDELNSQIETSEGLLLIDCGYGNIWWKTDNLKLQMYMEELTEKLQLVGV